MSTTNRPADVQVNDLLTGFDQDLGPQTGDQYSTPIRTCGARAPSPISSMFISELTVSEVWDVVRRLSNTFTTGIDSIGLTYNNSLQSFFATKFLGLHLDAHFSWESHVDVICQGSAQSAMLSAASAFNRAHTTTGPARILWDVNIDVIKWNYNGGFGTTATGSDQPNLARHFCKVETYTIKWALAYCDRPGPVQPGPTFSTLPKCIRSNGLRPARAPMSQSKPGRSQSIRSYAFRHL
ncbi:hypothetical protein J6590_026229 [Homalodisca vitripennis]|nr:hypothetical protein J6590_026229 [Homalodisca vitripennis]